MFVNGFDSALVVVCKEDVFFIEFVNDDKVVFSKDFTDVTKTPVEVKTCTRPLVTVGVGSWDNDKNGDIVMFGFLQRQQLSF